MIELTRQNFINEVFIKNNLTKDPSTPFFNIKGGKLMKIIVDLFFEDYTQYEKTTSFNELVTDRFMPKPNLKNVWIENVYQVEIRNFGYNSMVQYFEKNNDLNSLKLLDFFHSCKLIEDDWTTSFHRILKWFYARHYNVIKNDLQRSTSDIVNLYQTSGNIQDLIAVDRDRFIVKKPDLIEKYMLEKNQTYTVRKIFATYMISDFTYFIMYEDGEVVDRISTKHKKFDYVAVMLTGKYHHEGDDF